MKYDIFISYRRAGGWETAKHLFDLLTRDGYKVSFDIDTLRSGDFDTELLKRIDECTDFLLILNNGVFDRCFEIDKANDWLRCELAYALSKGKNIIPIMLDGFTEFPDNLPEDIARIARRNGPKFDKHYFDAFYQKLKSVFLETPSPEITSLSSTKSCILKIRPNLTCEVWVDGEKTVTAEVDRITKIPLNKGSFWLEFISTENEEDKYTCEYTIANPEELITVDLVSIRAKRKEFVSQKPIIKKWPVKDPIEKREITPVKEDDISNYLSTEELLNSDKYKFSNEGTSVHIDLIPFKDQFDKYGYKDNNTGEIIIAAKYDIALEFSNDLAKVAIKEFRSDTIPLKITKYGFIDKAGKEVIPLIYDDVGSFSEDFAQVKLNNKWSFINKTGKQITPLIYDDAYKYSEGLALVILKGKYGFIDKAGKKVISLKYDYAYSFSEGLSLVILKDKYGFIDKTEKVVIPLIYDGAYSFSESLAQVILKGKYGFIDKTGKVVIPLIYDGAYSFSEDFTLVKLNNKWGFINKIGKVMIPLIYDEAWRFNEGKAKVKLNGEEFHIDKSGNRIKE